MFSKSSTEPKTALGKSNSAQEGVTSESQEDVAMENLGEMMVPKRAVGLIVGKGGTRIKELKEISGAQIEVSTNSAIQFTCNLIDDNGRSKL